MKKLCPNGHLNDLTAFRCPTCNISLRYAQEVPDDYKNPDLPEPSESTEMSEMPNRTPEPIGGAPTGNSGNDTPVLSRDESCACRYPDPDPATAICQACDLPVTSPTEPNVRREATPIEANKTPKALFLILPDGYRIPIRAGVPIGRRAEYVGGEVATRLNRYKGVSRLHAWMGQEDDAVLLLDLGSRNGTWIDAVRLKPFSMTRVILSLSLIHISEPTRPY